MLKNKSLLPLLFVLLTLSMSGCDFVGDVLEFGFWTAVIIIAVVVLIIIGIIRAFKG